MRPAGKLPVPGPFPNPSAVNPEADAPVTVTRMRTVPRQERARAAVNRILRATGELLDDGGFDALTTTAVAERAGVNIATLYRYFPDKYALIEALAASIEADRVDRIGPVITAFATSADWRREFRTIFEKLLDLRLKSTGVKGLRRALNSSPQLWSGDFSGVGKMVERFATALRTRVPGMTVRRSEVVARTTLTMMVGLLDWAMTDPAQRRAVVREGGIALERYLAPHLD
jgi:AcrR family transcriptional regulator